MREAILALQLLALTLASVCYGYFLGKRRTEERFLRGLLDAQTRLEAAAFKGPIIVSNLQSWDNSDA